MPSHEDSDVIVPYRTLRRVVGVLGVALPVVVAVWGFFLLDGIRLEPSISSYYALRTRDAFVGILFTIAWFMFTYHGHDRRDDIAGNLACLFALGVALSPNSGTRLEQILHYGSASALFLVLSYFSICLFTLSKGGMTPEKRVRNRIYRTCGWTMVGAIVVMGAYGLAASPDSWLERNVHPVFWLEALTLWAFGISWFVKGETLFKDRVEADQDLAATGSATG